MVDRQEGAEGAAIWLLGEDIYTPSTVGDGLRVMNDPAAAGDYDYYPTRYTGTGDSGGVHSNSGIANLAFVLLVQGGQHPRGKTTNVVAGIDFQPAADIFYEANVACLTPGSNFAAARYCTADVHGGVHSLAVHGAWDAVGVPNDPPPPPPDPVAIVDGIPLSGQNAATGVVQQYTLLNVPQGLSVTCQTTCNNGDADLYLRFGTEADPNPNSDTNECGSYSATSNESCSTGAASQATTLYAAVHAYSAYTSLTIQCDVLDGSGGGSCADVGESCSTGAECCSGSCSGAKPSTRVCL